MSATSSSVRRAEAVPMDTEVTVVSTGPHADLLPPVRDTLDGGEEAILATAFVDTRESTSWMRRALCRVPPVEGSLSSARKSPSGVGNSSSSDPHLRSQRIQRPSCNTAPTGPQVQSALAEG